MSRLRVMGRMGRAPQDLEGRRPVRMVSEPSESLAQSVYAIVKKKIVEMELRPGELLLVQRLAGDLNASRTPVREALVRLTQEGLVIPATGRKLKVAELSLDDIREIYEVREALESMAVRKVASRITDAELAALVQDLMRLKDALAGRNYARFFDEDATFHHRLVDLAKNHRINEILNQLDARVQRIRYLTLLIPGRVDSTVSEHGDILECLKKRDITGADEAMRTHLSAVRQGISRLLETHEESNAGGLNLLSVVMSPRLAVAPENHE